MSSYISAEVDAAVLSEIRNMVKPLYKEDNADVLAWAKRMDYGPMHYTAYAWHVLREAERRTVMTAEERLNNFVDWSTTHVQLTEQGRREILRRDIYGRPR